MEISEEECYERNAADVRSIIRHAKLHESELRPLSQVLRFSDSGASGADNLRLLQLDNALLQELQQGGSVVFKGSQSDNAVLCTSTTTYDIKEAETSNSLLLVPGLLWPNQTKLQDDESLSESTEDKANTSTSPNNSLDNSGNSDTLFTSPRKLERKNILKVFYTYYETRPCKPRLDKLNELLQFTKFSGTEYEYTVDKKLLLTYLQLSEIIQASNAELIKGLENIQAIEIDGYYRVLSFDYEFRVLSYMLDLIEENSWPLDGINKTETISSLEMLVPPNILEALFGFYTEEAEGGLFRYRDDKVCRFLAQVLLRSAVRFNLADFMQAWKDSVPEGMQAEESMLSGMALVERDASPPCVRAFSEGSLPAGVVERFRHLFQVRPKWTIEEISPYIERFTTEKVNVNALLTKHARGSNQEGVRYYSAKHSK